MHLDSKAMKKTTRSLGRMSAVIRALAGGMDVEDLTALEGLLVEPFCGFREQKLVGQPSAVKWRGDVLGSNDGFDGVDTSDSFVLRFRLTCLL
ncbi:unnamed protein product [Rodentolepis nana]|uniref:Uncharacterized protein n=1 Tax=Rodentolepis nana TaxID=102285 RepID=A0A0R3TS28_RODNA|nr:unnamed protein product [Rodentolepis nana]